MPEPEPPASVPAAATDPGAEPPVLHSTRLPPAAAAALGTAPDDPAARNGELRDALDELRATLENPPGEAPREARRGPRPHLPRSGRAGTSRREAGQHDVAADAPPAHVENGRSRRTLAALNRPTWPAVLALMVVVAAAAVAGGLAGRRGPAGAGGAARATSTPAAAQSPGPSARPSTPSPSASSPASAGTPPATRPLPWPGGAVLVPRGLPRSGPGADAPGSELTAAIDPDGRHVDVYERAVLRPGTTSLPLAPAPTTGLPPALGALRPAVEDLQAEVDGRPVAPTATTGGWLVTVPDGITRVVLRYRLGGALVRQEPAPPGRADLLLRPLIGPAAQASADPVVVRIDDRRVGALYCPEPHPALCAVSAGTVLTATVPPEGAAVVLAQVTL